MNGLLDDFLVGLILVAGFGYTAYALGPKSLGTRMLTGMATLIGRLPAFVGSRALADRLSAKARLKSGGACGGCDNCGSEPAAKAPQSTRDEVRVPLAKIGKRRG